MGCRASIIEQKGQTSSIVDVASDTASSINDPGLSHEQIDIIHVSWANVEDPVLLASKVFRALFRKHPEVRKSWNVEFDSTYDLKRNRSFMAHLRVFSEFLDNIVICIHSKQQYTEMTRQIGEKHAIIARKNGDGTIFNPTYWTSLAHIMSEYLADDASSLNEGYSSDDVARAWRILLLAISRDMQIHFWKAARRDYGPKSMQKTTNEQQ